MADNLRVCCYSGHTYAQRPVSFIWQGADYKVEEIEKEWLEPGRRLFLVKARGNKSFRLCYNEARNSWSIVKGES